MTEKIDPMMKRVLLFLADRGCVLTEKRPFLFRFGGKKARNKSPNIFFLPKVKLLILSKEKELAEEGQVAH